VVCYSKIFVVIFNIKWTVTVRHGRKGEEEMHRADSFLRIQGPPFPPVDVFLSHIFLNTF